MRAAIYARYSSDSQRDASIEDQVRICKAWIEKEGMNLSAVYSDHGLSGATRLRPGYQQLLEDARRGEFTMVVAEALDRLSRDQEDTAGLFKNLSFAGVALVTLAEGAISELHVGLKGTMNALFLKDLAQKTHRGLEGRVRAGKSGGGLCFGYDVVRAHAADGTLIRGDRQVNEAEAATVRQIFQAFAAGRSPKAIALELNRAGVSGPRGTAWGPSTIYGNWRRGTGILNNELYVGRLVWNRQRFVKDPQSGRRVAKPNPAAQWIVQEVPELRIIPDELWDAVKARQTKTRILLTDDRRGVRSERARRPRYLFSGLLRCGACHGGLSMISATHYGCSNHRNRGTCANNLTIRRDTLEESVLNGLKDRLMEPELVKEFVAEYHRELNRLAAGQDQQRHQRSQELSRVEKSIREIIEAIKSGIRSASMRSELEELEEAKTKLGAEIEDAPASPVRLHPALAETYRQKVDKLHQALSQDEERGEAANILRGLIDEIRLIPQEGALGIYLVGNLATILALSTKQNPGPYGTGVLPTLVAGTGFEPVTFRL